MEGRSGGERELKVEDVREWWFAWRMGYSTYLFRDTSSQGVRLLPRHLGTRGN